MIRANFCHPLSWSFSFPLATSTSPGSVERILRIYAITTAQQLPGTLPFAILEPTRIMRLLKCDNNGDLSLTEFFESDIPKYAILSHSWGTEEVTFKHLANGTSKNKSDYGKI